MVCFKGITGNNQESLTLYESQSWPDGKSKFRGVQRMFEGFDFTNFWEDSAYALKAYVSDSPSDALIASVEQELGYKGSVKSYAQI